jgi:hypothetical protein
MHENLWAGVELKLQNAHFHLTRMQKSLDPLPRTGWTVAQGTAGNVDTQWQRSFYAHFDAFLSAARSVPEIIKWCFGVDHHRARKFDQLPAGERARRCTFMEQFQPLYDAFGQRPLSTDRNISAHQTGYPPVTVRIGGLFGVTYEGGPVNHVPTSEAREIDDPTLPWVPTLHHPVRPEWDDFQIGEQVLFPACREYLLAAQELIDEARRISNQVHGAYVLTPA